MVLNTPWSTDAMAQLLLSIQMGRSTSGFAVSRESGVLNDLRLAIRSLSRKPGFAAIAVITLALGIGASTAIFSVVNGVLLRSLPYPEPDSLMQVQTEFANGFRGAVSYPNFEDLREQNRSFSELSAYSAWTTSATAEGEGFLVAQANVSPGFFSVLGVTPGAGRTFSPDEERAGTPVAVVSHSYWQSRLEGDEDLADQSVRVGDQVYSVIGVMPRGYDFPVGTELWVPRAPATENRTAHNWRVVGRLSDNVSPDQAQQDLSTIAQRLKQQHGDDTAMEDAAVQPVLEQLVGNVRPALLVLLGASGVLLLVACVNVANLLLARALSRDRESALRLALGARPVRLARSFVAESLVLALAGAALGVMVAIVGVPALLALEPGGLPRIGDIGMNWTVLAFSLCVSVSSAVLIGLVPGIRAARRDMREALADSHRIQSSSLLSRRLRGVLVVAQLALTVVLLVGAGLLGRSLQNLLAVDPGFRTEGAVVMDVTFPLPRDALPEGAETRMVGFIEELLARLRAIPGVERAGGVNYFPLRGGGPNGTFVVLDRPDEISSFEAFSVLADQPARSGNAEFRVASADYFRAMEIPLLRGRFFDDRDSADAPHAALISTSLAEARWPGEDPLGELVFFGNMDGDFRPFTVVGVVGDVQESGIGVPPRPTFYADFRQRPRTAFSFNIAIQGQADAAAVTATARRIARELDPVVPVGFRTLREIGSAALADRQFVLLLVSLFGAVALVLATTGVYGVVVFMASQRTPEIGVRVALGAQARDVERLLVRQGAVFAIAGIVTGLAASFAATRVLTGFLYEVDRADPATYASVAVALLTAAAVASWIPAHRAALVDPVDALRHE